MHVHVHTHGVHKFIKLLGSGMDTWKQETCVNNRETCHYYMQTHPYTCAMQVLCITMVTESTCRCTHTCIYIKHMFGYEKEQDIT